MVENNIRGREMDNISDFADYIKKTNKATMYTDSRGIDAVIQDKKANVSTIEAKGKEVQSMLAKIEQKDSLYTQVR
jgi:hypothetical protein